MHTPQDHPADGHPISLPEQPTQLDSVDHAVADPTRIFACGQRLGPYRIERLLGEGGMGAVYLAEQLEPVQRPVALKLIRGQLRGGLAEAYFMVERQALARMDHPAIAKVYDAGTTAAGHPYFAMEWIDGPTLAAFCAAHTRKLHEILALFVRISRGVHHAHQKGVIHRDLKPGNVLIAQVDGQSFPKIIDFGVAIGAAHNTGGAAALTQSAGTLGYMSPEQISGQPREIDIRSDVYALGVMLYEALSPPSLQELCKKIGLDNRDLHSALFASVDSATGTETRITSVVRELAPIPAEIRWVLAKAVQPDRSRRYDSAEEFASDLERFLVRRPLRAVPSTRAYRARLFAERNRGAIFAAALIVLTLVAGTGAAIYGMLTARAAAQRATIEADKSRETSRFLTDVLSGVDPEEARDLDKTLLNRILDRAADRAKRELAAQPEVLADIEGTIGGSYNSVSEYKLALEHTQHGYDLSLAHAGPDALQTLKIERLLARELFNSGETQKACDLNTRNYAAFRRTRGDTDAETLRSGLDVVQCESELGDFTAADNLIRKLQPDVERVSGTDSTMMLDAMNIHASVLDYQGRYEEGEALFKDIVARETKLWGAEDPKTLDTLNNFAILYLESHRYADGASILRAMLPICEKIYGPEHGFTLDIVSNLAGALRQQGAPEKIAESGPYYKRALDGVLKKYGEKKPNAIRARHNYANYLLDVGDVTQAIALQQRATADAKEVFGPDNPVTGEAEFGLGKALLRGGHYPEAEQALLAAVAVKQKEFGADHWRLDEYMAPLQTLYQTWGKPEQAADWAKRRAALKAKPANAA